MSGVPLLKICFFVFLGSAGYWCHENCIFLRIIEARMIRQTQLCEEKTVSELCTDKINRSLTDCAGTVGITELAFLWFQYESLIRFLLAIQGGLKSTLFSFLVTNNGRLFVFLLSSVQKDPCFCTGSDAMLEGRAWT